MQSKSLKQLTQAVSTLADLKLQMTEPRAEAARPRSPSFSMVKYQEPHLGGQQVPG